MNYDRLCRTIDYHFQNQSLLITALTHCSVSQNNNERLEYLGDSIVNFVIAEVLFEKLPPQTEGQLSRMRASLVRKETLALVAKELDLGEYISLGTGELKSGGFRRESILADALEALIAAIYLDSDLNTCKQKILSWFSQRLSGIRPESSNKDAKTQLQEYLQAKQLSLPTYSIVKTEGEDHNQIFHLSCRVEGIDLETIGKGSSRRRAEQRAAKQFLQEITDE